MQRETHLAPGIAGTEDEAAREARELWRRVQARAIRWARAESASGTSHAPGVIEAFLGVAIVSAIGAVVPGQWGLLALHPHPLWIVVLGIAIRYGAPSGTIAGVLAAISQCLALGFRPGVPYGSLREHDLIEPFLYIVIGVLIGQAARAQRRRLAAADLRYRQATDALRALSEEHTTTHAVKVELEKQIVGQSDSVATLYEMAKKLETLRVEALYPAMLGLIQRFMAAEACGYYRVSGDLAERVESLPPRPSDHTAAPHPPHGLLAQAIAERRVVTVRDRLLALGPDALGHEPVLLAGPLLDRDGAVIGAIAIERLPFIKLTPTAVRLFGLILDWGSTALQNATLYTETRAESMKDAETGAYTGPHMLRLARQEAERSDRYRLPLAVVVPQIDRFDAVPPPLRAALARTVIEAARDCLRTVDVIGHHPTPGAFVLILPMTDAYAVQVAVARIDDRIQAANLRPYGDHRPLLMNYGFLTNLRASQETEAIIRDLFAEQGGAYADDAPPAPPHHPVTLRIPESLDDRMVGD